MLKDCHILYTIGGFSALTGATAGEGERQKRRPSAPYSRDRVVLMFLRVWVLSGCTKKMGWYLTAQFLVRFTVIQSEHVLLICRLPAVLDRDRRASWILFGLTRL